MTLIGSGGAGRARWQGVLRRALVTLALSTVSFGSQASLAAPDGSEAAKGFVMDRLPLTAADLREVEQGGTVVRTLETVDAQEVATVGIMRVAVPAAFYVDQLRRVDLFKSASRAVLELGTFSVPATIGDLERLSLTPGEAEKLGQCRPQKCDVQLSREAIDQIRRHAGRTGFETRAVGERTFRGILVDLVNAYLERGDSALMIYADAKRPVDAAEAFRRMIGSNPALLERLPVLSRHLASFPTMTSGVDDVIYWSKQQLGSAPVVTITHLAVARIDDPRVQAFAAASKQIYGSRYFDSSLGITVMVDAEARDGRPGSYVVYANRSRIDALGGFWGRLARPVVRARTRSGIRSSLDAARSLVERRFEQLAMDTP